MRFFSAYLSALFLSTLLNANEHYLLPEQRSDLVHTLKLKIERAEKITLITRRLESPTLQKSIEKALKRGSTLHLVTTSIESASRYAKYRGSEVDVPRYARGGDTFSINLLLIDTSDVCFSSLPFTEDLLKSAVGEVICTTANEEVAFAREIEQRFTQRFEPYSR